jgi:hypothetical protein
MKNAFLRGGMFFHQINKTFSQLNKRTMFYQKQNVYELSIKLSRFILAEHTQHTKVQMLVFNMSAPIDLFLDLTATFFH